MKISLSKSISQFHDSDDARRKNQLYINCLRDSAALSIVNNNTVSDTLYITTGSRENVMDGLGWVDGLMGGDETSFHKQKLGLSCAPGLTYCRVRKLVNIDYHLLLLLRF